MPSSARLLSVTLLLACQISWAAGVTVRFDPATPSVGPFPTDFLTVADTAQKTGRRVNLPLPDCRTQPSSCEETGLLNQLDGFNIQPRVRVQFSGAVNPDTLRSGIFVVWLDKLTGEEPGLQPAGHFTTINQVVYDPPTLTAYGKTDEALDQRRRYLLVVTDAVRDASGDGVEPEAGFLGCAGQGPNDYCAGLARAVSDLAGQLAPRRIVAASVFTTLSATAWIEKARAAIGISPLNVQRASPNGVFRLADLASVVWRPQVRANPPAFTNTPLPLALLSGVGRVAFGSFRSPSFLDDKQLIAAAPTGADVSLPEAAGEIFFEVYLPASPMPAAGYPVVIFGHGLGDSRFGGATAVAATMARNGLATIAINAVGHGFGPQGTIVITQRDGGTTELPAGGRGIDLNGDGTIDSSEGCVIVPGPVGIRDCLRQTALDLMQLVRAIQVGIDLDGDAVVDLDRNRIYYVGQSLGSFYGTLAVAVEPGIAAATLNVGGGSVVETARWSPSFRPLVIAALGFRNPSLLNRAFSYEENYVLRDRPVKVNDVDGAIAIQNELETLEWIEAIGDPVAYAPHLRTSSLPGVAAKPVLWQFAKGDQTVPNPSNTNLIRAADLFLASSRIEAARSREFPQSTRRSISYYRHDLARAAAGDLGANPHAFLTNVLSAGPGAAIALAAQQQIAAFFASGGTAVSDMNPMLRPLFGQDLFEVPDFLTIDLNF